MLLHIQLFLLNRKYIIRTETNRISILTIIFTIIFLKPFPSPLEAARELFARGSQHLQRNIGAFNRT